MEVHEHKHTPTNTSTHGSFFTHQIQVYLFNLSNMCNLFLLLLLFVRVGVRVVCVCFVISRMMLLMHHCSHCAALILQRQKKKSIPCTFLLLCSSFSQSKSAQGPHRPAPLIALLSTAVASLYRPLVTPLQILALSF